MADRYRAVLIEVEQAEQAEKTEAVTSLTPGQLDRLGSFYNRIIHQAVRRASPPGQSTPRSTLMPFRTLFIHHRWHCRCSMIF